MKHNRPPQIADSPLANLEDHGEFIMRHIGPREEHIQTMLEAIADWSTSSETPGCNPCTMIRIF